MGPQPLRSRLKLFLQAWLPPARVSARPVCDEAPRGTRLRSRVLPSASSLSAQVCGCSMRRPLPGPGHGWIVRSSVRARSASAYVPAEPSLNGRRCHREHVRIGAGRQQQLGNLVTDRVEEWDRRPSPSGSSRRDAQQGRVGADSLQFGEGLFGRRSVVDRSSRHFFERGHLTPLLGEQLHLSHFGDLDRPCLPRFILRSHSRSRPRRAAVRCLAAQPRG